MGVRAAFLSCTMNHQIYFFIYLFLIYNVISNEEPIYWLQNIIRNLSYDEQINEINQKIYELVNKKQHANKIDNYYEQIKELKHMKNNIINRL